MTDYLRTGSLGVDILLQGGWKTGTINEVWGSPGSGKTLLGRYAVLNSSVALWMSLGTEIPAADSSMAVTQPENAEQAFETMFTAAYHGLPLIVVDSANGLIRQREIDGDPDYVPHPQREYKDELTSLKKACKVSGTTVLFLSKPRDKDREPVRGTGISEKARDRVLLFTNHAHQDGSRDIAARVYGGPHLTDFTIRPGTGIDWALELARLGVAHGLIRKNGSWYEVNMCRYQGIEALAWEVRDNTRLAAWLDSDIRAIAGI